MGAGLPLEGREPSRGFRCGSLSEPWLESLPDMKIAVCVKQVPDATVTKRIDPQTKRLDRSGEGALNHFDTQAVEEALRIKEREAGSEVVLVSLGPARSLDSVRKALAMGADRAVLVSDEAAEGSDLVATSRALGAALERESADLVVFGQQGSDSDGAVLWAAVADRLRQPVISQAAELEVADGKVKVKRQTEFGYDVIEAPLPAVVAVSDAINEPRYPSLKGIMGAKSKPQETVSRTAVLELADPPARGDALKVEDDGSGAEKIVEFLAERKLV
jgi:electron transfer flavoprotein beta subunit